MVEAQSTVALPTRAFVIHPDMGDRRDQRRSPDLALEEAVAQAEAERDPVEFTRRAQESMAGADLSGEEMSVRVVPRQADEFTCTSCFLVHHRSQLATDGKNGPVCTECAA